VLEGILYRITAQLPCRLIDGDEGEPYLERYYLFGALGWHAYLHRFMSSDPDRGLHDHPWSRAVSFVLTGGYDEQRPTAGDPDRISVRTIRPFRFNFLRGEDFHRVVLREDRPAWTLFLHGPRTKGWGFAQGGRLRPMSRDAGEFRHRDWWKTASRGKAMRADREEAGQRS